MSTEQPSLPQSLPVAARGPAELADANQLEARVTALETRFPRTSWVYSANFFKRALAIWGHVIVIQLIIAIIIWAIIFACVFVFGLSVAGLSGR